MKVIRSANAPKLISTIKSEFEHELHCMQGKARRNLVRLVFVIHITKWITEIKLRKLGNVTTNFTPFYYKMTDFNRRRGHASKEG